MSFAMKVVRDVVKGMVIKISVQVKPYEQVKAMLGKASTAPESLEKCGRLDLGLSHEDITNSIVP